MPGRLDIVRSEKGNMIRFLQPKVASVVPLTTAERLDTMFLSALALLNDECPLNPSLWLCKMSEDESEEACDRCWRNYLLYIRNGCAQDPYDCDRHQWGIEN